MTRKSHHRSRSSIDRVLDLLDGLDESQMETLLREAESTVSGNVAVSKGIDIFGRPGGHPLPAQPPTPSSPAPRRKFLTSLSPRKQTELRRRLSKRASTHKETSAGGAGSPGSPQSYKKTPRSYKRISRPIFPMPAPTATGDLAELLAAYLLDASITIPSSASTSSTLSSPTTPRAPFSPYTQSENEPSGFDLLEPAPPGGPGMLDIFSGPVRQPTRKISGIFEVLDDAVSLNQHL